MKLIARKQQRFVGRRLGFGLAQLDAASHHHFTQLHLLSGDSDPQLQRLAVDVELPFGLELFRSAVQVVAQLRELPSQEADQAHVAQSMGRSVEDMRTYAARMVQAAQQQEASFSREYQASVDALVEASRQTAWLIAALVGGSLYFLRGAKKAAAQSHHLPITRRSRA